MIAIIQRVTQAHVAVNDRIVGQIERGLVALVAVTRTDTAAEAEWMAAKLAGFRVFRAEGKHFEADITHIGGGMLLVSNFTVAAKTRRGRRPSLDAAAEPAKAQQIFEHLVSAVRMLNIPVATGEFGADMRVSLVNDGPATFIVDSSAQD